MLKLLAISKRFGGVVALDRVNLSLNRGEVLAVIGENGAGKSTLMNILGGVVAPDGGSILLDEKPVQIRSVSDSVGLGIGFVHQELNLLDNLDVAGNLFLGASRGDWDGFWMAERWNAAAGRIWSDWACGFRRGRRWRSCRWRKGRWRKSLKPCRWTRGY